MKSDRIGKILVNMENHGVDQLLVSCPSSIFYLTGLWIHPGERMLVLYLNRAGVRRLFLNELFPLEDGAWEDVCFFNDREDSVKKLADAVADRGAVGVDGNWPSGFLLKLMSLRSKAKIVNGSTVIDEVRMIKDAEEIDLMRRASAINDETVSDLIGIVHENHAEKELSKISVRRYEQHGANGPSFCAVAYGPHAAEPHHDPDDTKLKPGDCVIFDLGCRIESYWSDMTRTVFYGEPAKKHKDIFRIVSLANQAGIDAIKPGARFRDVDRAARSVIEKAGYGKYFTHRTGHNIGIDIHEFPDVGEINEMPVQPGMIFSIEPGIYLPGQVGVRLEDLVLATDSGCEVLNKYTKELQIL